MKNQIRFNEVRLFENEPVRMWSKGNAQDGRYIIWPDGLMRWFPNFQIEQMPLANAEQAAVAFPAQDERPAELM
jgi:hypothetical protein